MFCLSYKCFRDLLGSKTFVPQNTTVIISALSSTKMGNKLSHKLVLVVRKDLPMTKGKIAAQCAHAAVNAYRSIEKNNKKDLRMWDLCGQQKVALQCPNEETLLQLFTKANKLGLNAALIMDAGRTQIDCGTKTVLGIGPGPSDLIDKVTGELKLL
ncbi:unnamed protein product [Clavelina lepadiformis]|uniref:peptidyl-tRNA hydrolase n=1 Tax=Clavelina lepadiformis TaxID=159417 RepID=A0ABP0FZH7_CLALP